MKFLIPIGQALFIALWAVLITNIFFPFPGQAHTGFLILLGLIVILHVINLLMFMAAFHGQVKTTRKDYAVIFVFGVIGWLMVVRRNKVSA